MPKGMGKVLHRPGFCISSTFEIGSPISEVSKFIKILGKVKVGELFSTNYGFCFAANIVIGGSCTKFWLQPVRPTAFQVI